VHPPVEQASGEIELGAKEPLILSVGRFFQGAHTKRQDVLVEAFRELRRQSALESWELHLVGSVHTSGPHRHYFERVRRLAEGLPVHLHPDLPRERLRDLYRRASIYWHAAGFGADLEADPEAAEHFGMTTAEAMSWGAVPLVFGAGGQPEVVGAAGLTWTSPGELGRHTVDLVCDPDERRRRARLAQAAAAAYSPARFRARMTDVLRPLLQAPVS